MGDAFDFDMDCFEFDEDDLELLKFDLPMETDIGSAISTDNVAIAEQSIEYSSQQVRVLDDSGDTAQKKVVKGASKGAGTKLNKNTIQKSTKKVSAAEVVSRQQPPKIPLVAFPQFDKCDSLVYFPHSYSRHLNCGDVTATSALLYTHADKDCQVKCVCGTETYFYPVKQLRMVLNMSNDLGPDRIMCVHTTKVVDNQIRSVIYMKLTDSQSLYSAVCGNAEDPAQRQLAKRSNRFQQFLTQPGLNAEVKQGVEEHAKADDDVLLYMRMDFVLTFDDRTRKITFIESDVQLTSIHSTPSISCSTHRLA